MTKNVLIGAGFSAAALVFLACGDAELAIQEAYDDCISRLGGAVEQPNGGSGGQDGKGGAGGVPNVIIPECAKATDCPKPEEPRCAEAVCTSGKCGFLFRPVAKLESQIKGDCVSQYCDGQGKVMAVEDPSDVYNDGKQCTFDVCAQGIAKPMHFPDGFTCPETGLGVCYAGACVACISDIPATDTCGIGLACAGTKCVPMHCFNSLKDAASGETAIDCGGPCLPCGTGEVCKVNADCIQGVCAGSCSIPTCTDGVKNDGETGIDCGGPPSCKRCSAGEGCDLPSDCESGVCWAGSCEPPKCSDGIANGDEDSVDCGGSCPACGG